MSFAAAAADMHAGLFETFGVDATAKRGIADAVPVRIIVDYDGRTYGEYGQVVGRATLVDVQLSEWAPKQGDVLAWTDHLGSHTRTVAAPVKQDAYVAQVVVRG